MVLVSPGGQIIYVKENTNHRPRVGRTRQPWTAASLEEEEDTLSNKPPQPPTPDGSQLGVGRKSDVYIIRSCNRMAMQLSSSFQYLCFPVLEILGNVGPGKHRYWET